MKFLIIKLGADGDVVRTTTLLRSLKGQITWVTAANAWGPGLDLKAGVHYIGDEWDPQGL